MASRQNAKLAKRSGTEQLQIIIFLPDFPKFSSLQMQMRARTLLTSFMKMMVELFSRMTLLLWLAMVYNIFLSLLRLRVIPLESYPSLYSWRALIA